MKNNFIKLAALKALTFASLSVNAITFDFQNPNANLANPYNQSNSYSKDGLDLNVTGWSYGGSSYATSGIQQAATGLWTGYGVEHGGEPDHAIDNAGGDIDMLLLSFSQAVSLDSLSAGYIHLGSTVSIMAYTGNSFGGDFTGVNEWGDLIGQGWVDNQSSGTDIGYGATAVNNENIKSNFWIVGAYDTSMGNNSVTQNILNQAQNAALSHCPSGYALYFCNRCWVDAAQAASGGCNIGQSIETDYFKLDQLSVTVSETPLPGTLALFATGLAGFGALRMRKKAKKA